MPQENLAAHDEGNGQWLPLIEYSIKSGVSLSTIRRKIKSNSIPFRLEKGKYLIFSPDAGSASQTPEVKPTTIDASYHRRETVPFNPPSAPKTGPSPSLTSVPFRQKLDRMVGGAEETDNAVRMLSEAYELALHEKDERLRLLERRAKEQEERLNELKLLVQVLEEKYEVRY